MAGGLVNRQQVAQLAPQPMRAGGLAQPAGGAYNGLSALPSLKTPVRAGNPLAMPQAAPVRSQMAARSAKPAWLDAQYLSDLAGLQQGLTQQTSPIREQLTQLGFATGGFTPYQAAVRDIGNAYQSNVYGMDSSLAARGILGSGSRTVGTTKLGQERSTNLANANQEMGPAAIARLRRQIMEARQGFNQSRLAAQAGARERLREQRRIAELNKQQLAALQNQYKAPSMQSIINAINGGGGGGTRVQMNGRMFDSYNDLRDGGLHRRFHGLRRAAWQHLVHDGPGVFSMGGATFTIGMDGRIRKQQPHYSQMQGPVFAPMGTRG